MKAENVERNGYLQRDSAEHEEYAGVQRSYSLIWEERNSAQPKLLERIMDKDNLNRAYKRVKANKGAAGVDGMTVDEMLPYFRENQKEWIERIYNGKFTPSPVKRVEIPKPDGGVRKLGIPTVTDRLLQQAITQQLIPIYEPIFSENSYGYRPNRGAKGAIFKIKEYAEQGYIYAVALDLSKYFDTINHDKLLEILRRNVKDERVIQLIKRYLKSGVMENGVVTDTDEGSPQGGNISPLLANIYLNEFDHEFEERGVPFVRYADDIVLLTKSERAAKRILESSTRYLEDKLKLTVNKDKSKAVYLFSNRKFKYLGFAFGRRKGKVIIRVHAKSWENFKKKLKMLSSRKKIQSIKPALKRLRQYIIGWMNYYGIANIGYKLNDLDGWLYHRIRMCIWKQWRKPRTKMRHMLAKGVTYKRAFMAGNTRRGIWFITGTDTVGMALPRKDLQEEGFCDLVDAYWKVRVNY